LAVRIRLNVYKSNIFQNFGAKYYTFISTADVMSRSGI